jgi:hypothetical protein
MQSKTSKIILLAFIVAVVLLSVVYFPHRNGNPTKATSPPTNIPSTAGTTTAPINSNIFTTSGKTISNNESSSNPDSSVNTLLQGMTITFDDEFNSFSRYVDANGNVTCNSGGTGTWQTVYYFCSRTNPGNDEAEVYIDPGFLSFLKDESTAMAETDLANPFSISNGILAIKAQPSSQQIVSAVGSWAQYTSGMITTQFSFSQEYGYFEMRAKLPAGRGLWPAFWLLPADKAWPPEIDVLEAFGDTSLNGQGGHTMIHYASHALVSNENCGAWHNVETDITAGFHTYGADVEPTGITYFFDGQPYATCPANSAIDKPLYMIANLAVGGDGSWPGTPDASNTWPAYLYIDYIRAYQKK